MEQEMESKQEATALTFDEILEDKEYQAEFDRRVQKAIATSKTNMAKEIFGKEDADIKKETNSIRGENKSLREVNAILGKGITDKDEIEFIQFKVSKMEGDFAKNLDKYLEDNPKFNPTPKAIKKVSSSPSLEGKKMTGENETNRIMNDVIRSVRK